MVTYSSATENKNSAGKPNHKNGSTCNTAIEGPSHGHRQYTVHRKLGDVWMYDSETCEQTNKQTGRKKTDRHTHHNTPLPYRGWSKNKE